MDDMKKDSRFSHISRDPRFRGMRTKDRKVKIDKRFKDMFSDDKFKLKYTVDKRGRPLHTTTNENLRRFYDLSESDEDSVEEDEEDEEESEPEEEEIKTKTTKKISSSKTGEKLSGESDSGEDEEDGTDEEEDTEQKVGTNEESGTDEESEADDSDMDSPDYARGEGDLSSTDEDSTDMEEDTVELPWGEMDHDVERDTDNITDRLAVCNMDWDRIRAEDLMVLFNSFKPPGGIIKSITIYPSEYGAERMAEESRTGPTELVTWSDDEETHDETERHAEKLRVYQLNRLKYYYGVIECDCKTTANHIYEQCDSLVYEGSSNGIDLRFIPEGMTFEQDHKWRVTEMPSLSSYKASNFISSALQQSKVNLTWDETDPARVQLMTKNFKKDEIEEMDMRDYLASDSDNGVDAYAGLEAPDVGAVSGDETEETQIQRYRALLQDTQDTDKHYDNALHMEISWEPGLKSNTEDLLRKAALSDASPWEQYLEKKREKRKAKQNKQKQVPEESDSDIAEGDVSDSEIPDGFTRDDLNSQEKSVNKKQRESKVKKKKKAKKLTAEELKEQKEQEAELKLLMSDDEDGKKHFNLRDILQEDQQVKGKKKRRMRHILKEKMKEDKARKEAQGEDFKLDVADSRFSDMYKNSLFNIDPTASEYKKTKSMDMFVHEKLKRRTGEATNPHKSVSSKKQKLTNTDSEPAGPSQTTPDVSLATLIKSVKAKTKSVQEKKKKLKKAS